jgi:hypothetical protein
MEIRVSREADSQIDRIYRTDADFARGEEEISNRSPEILR